MATKGWFASWFMALFISLASGLIWAQGVERDLPQRICANLADESNRILNDTNITTKYQSPYIAAEIYQQVVEKSLAGADLQAPSMAALPCGDTVAAYLMAIKKRMEYNRFDLFVRDHRVLIISILLLALMAGGAWLVYRKKQRVRDSSVGAAS